MSQVITAIYENGVFRSEQPLDLPAATRVQLVVEPLPNGAPVDEDPDDEAWREFERLCEETSINSGGEKLTRDQLHDRR